MIVSVPYGFYGPGAAEVHTIGAQAHGAFARKRHLGVAGHLAGRQPRGVSLPRQHAVHVSSVLQKDFMWHKGFPPAVVALGWGEVPFVHPVSNPVEVTPFRSGLLTLTLVARGNCLHRMDSEVGDNSALQSRSFFSSSKQGSKSAPRAGGRSPHDKIALVAAAR